MYWKDIYIYSQPIFNVVEVEVLVVLATMSAGRRATSAGSGNDNTPKREMNTFWGKWGATELV